MTMFMWLWWYNDMIWYDDIWRCYDDVELLMWINVDVVVKWFVGVWMCWFDDVWCVGVMLWYMMKGSCNMNYIESCIVESILGIHASWSVLFKEWCLKTGRLIGNIRLSKYLKTRDHSAT